jgi:hypothetical protein
MITTTDLPVNRLKLEKELRAAGAVVLGITFDPIVQRTVIYTPDESPDITPVINAHVFVPEIDWEAEWAEAITLEQKAALIVKNGGSVRHTQLTDTEINDGRIYY